MLRNTFLPVTQLVRLQSGSNPSVQHNNQFELFITKPDTNFHFLRLTLTLKYNFFKNDVTIDYNKNYYEMLEVSQTAQLAEIKKSFYKLAKQSHPDTSKGNQEQFKLINEAYNVLSHEERRKIYDKNRVRKDENPNDARGDAQRNSRYQARGPSYEQDLSNSQQFESKKQQAYYHYNRGQWQQFRSGYKYHISPQSEYFSSITNNFSTDKIYQTMKKSHSKKTQKDQAFLSEMEQYLGYVEKVRQKKQKDINDYHVKLQQIQKQLYEQKRERFKKTLIGRGFTRVQNAFAKVSEALSKLLNKSTKVNEDSK